MDSRVLDLLAFKAAVALAGDDDRFNSKVRARTISDKTIG